MGWNEGAGEVDLGLIGTYFLLGMGDTEREYGGGSLCCGVCARDDVMSCAVELLLAGDTCTLPAEEWDGVGDNELSILKPGSCDAVPTVKGPTDGAAYCDCKVLRDCCCEKKLDRAATCPA